MSDRTGQRIGTRVVLADYGSRVKVLCDCGALDIVRTKRVGPCARCVEDPHEAQYRALVGSRMGKREVLEYRRAHVSAEGRDRHQLLMRCDCGSELWIMASQAVRSRSCRVCRHQPRDHEPRRHTSELAALLAERCAEAPWIWRNTCSCAAGERCVLCTAQIEAVGELVTAIGRELTYAETGALLGFTRQRTEQIEIAVRKRLGKRRDVRELAEGIEDRGASSWASWSAAGEIAAGGGAE